MYQRNEYAFNTLVKNVGHNIVFHMNQGREKNKGLCIKTLVVDLE